MAIVQMFRCDGDSMDERFDDGWLPEPMSGCHLWIPNLTTNGYGQFYFEGVVFQAHRFAYMRAKGPIAESLVIDHVCRNRCCVNPTHLRAVTSKENTHAPGSLAKAAAEARQTTCIHGHPFDGKPYKGKRRCKTCARNTYHRRKAA